jgi:hypothetical protein
MIQSKRKSKVHSLAGGWEDSSRRVGTLWVLRTQDFIVACTDGVGHSGKTGLCLINSHSVRLVLVA